MSHSDEIMSKALEIQELLMKIVESDLIVTAAFDVPDKDFSRRLIEPYEDVIDRFRWAADLDPEQYDPMIENIENTKLTLASTEIEGIMPKLAARLFPWTGDAADSFDENFLTPFDAIRAHQVDLAENIRRAVQATRDIEETTQRDMVELQNGIIEVLKKIKKEEKGFFDKALAVAKVVGTIAGTAAAMTLPGAGIAGVLGLIAITGEATAMQETFNVQVEGESPSEVLESMDKAINQLREAMLGEEDKLIELLSEDLKMIDEQIADPNERIPTYIPRKPEIADGVTDLDRFKPPAYIAD
ncbi:hypothetical protein [Stackebrandtia soli]|uniref:hypothetical protein n=1 Tax=Stackebrandtia soli TaxID=1892856 RepID=UPI0039E91799